MKRKTADKLGPRGQSMVEAISKTDHGMSSKEVAKLFGVQLNTVSQHLNIARRLKFVDVSRMGGETWVWFTPSQKEAAKAHEAERRRKSKEARLAKQRHYCANYRRKTGVPIADDGRESLPIKRVIVDAATTSMPTTSAPASVFHLGAML